MHGYKDVVVKMLLCLHFTTPQKFKGKSVAFRISVISGASGASAEPGSANAG